MDIQTGKQSLEEKGKLSLKRKEGVKVIMENEELESKSAYLVLPEFFDGLQKARMDYSKLIEEVKKICKEVNIKLRNKDDRIRELEMIVLRNHEDLENYGSDLCGISDIVKFEE